MGGSLGCGANCIIIAPFQQWIESIHFLFFINTIDELTRHDR